METRHHVHYDSAECMVALPDASIHLVVTSPPYPMIAMWDDVFSRWDTEAAQALVGEDGEKAFGAMHRRLDGVWAEVCRVLAPGGFACINIGDATRSIGGRFALYPNHMRVQHALTAQGLTPLPGIIWRKQTNAPNKFMGSGVLPAGAYVTLEHEHILVFRKGGKREFAGDTLRQRRRESALFWEERNAWFSDVWFDVKGTRQSLAAPEVRRRSAAFPVEIAHRLVAMYSVKGDRVLDPFLGTGTTMAAAMAAGRHSVGYDIDPGLRDAVAETAGHAAAVSRRFHLRRLSEHLTFWVERQRQGRTLKHRSRPYGFPVMMRQETDLVFEDAVSVAATGTDAWSVTYAAGPHPAFVRDWDAWLAAGGAVRALSATVSSRGAGSGQRNLFE